MRHTQHSAARNVPLCRAVTLAQLTDVLPSASITHALAQTGVQTVRVRRLDLTCTALLVVAMHLTARKRLGEVLHDLMHPARLQRPTLDAVPGDAAIWYRRRQLGIRPVVALFHQLARPQATPQTRGAWLGAWRLVALDGSTFRLPATPENRRAFGAPTNQHGAAAPQLRAQVLVECGTHAVLDAGCWPYRTNEHPCAQRLVRSVTADMLVLYDRGLHSYELITRVRARGAHVLGRLPAGVQVTVVTRLPDGSTLADLQPQSRPGQRHVPPLRVRLITYTIDEPDAEPGGYRLITTLLDAHTYPAQLLALTYHERWEVENYLDEVKTHLDLTQRPFRSQHPLGVIQEFYGLLIAHALVRALMHASALEADLDPDRLSFVHAVQVIERYRPDCQRATARELPRLATLLRRELRERLLPPRRDRRNPRTVHIPPRPFPPKKAGSSPGRYCRPITETLRLI